MTSFKKITNLLITMGDPAGIGPEIVVKAWAKVRADARVACIGDARLLAQWLTKIGIDGSVNAIETIEDALYANDTLDVLDLWPDRLEEIKPGNIQTLAGDLMYKYVINAIDLAKSGRVDAVVTCPINKEALALANHNFDGHTEIFANETNSKSVTMMLACGHFHVTHVSTHCSLRKAIERCKTARIYEVLKLTHEGLTRLGYSEPRIAVAGLNPHAGENGLFGDEEEDQIRPAIDLAKLDGVNVYPFPVPPDTVFHRMYEGREFEGVVAQYHDQGHIPAKLLDFFGGVNITLGLPIVRTSVDHGTAYDIAGKGVANAQSLVNAIQLAEQLALTRRNL